MNAPSPIDLIAPPLTDLAALAAADALDLHLAFSRDPLDFPRTLILTSIDLTLALHLQHSAWHARLARLRRQAAQGDLADTVRLQRLVTAHPLPA